MGTETHGGKNKGRTGKARRPSMLQEALHQVEILDEQARKYRQLLADRDIEIASLKTTVKDHEATLKSDQMRGELINTLRRKIEDYRSVVRLAVLVLLEEKRSCIAGDLWRGYQALW